MNKKIRPLYFSIAVAVFMLIFVFEALLSKSLTYHFSFVGYGGTFKNNDIKLFGIPIYWILMILGFIITVVLSLSKRKTYQINMAEALFFPCVFLLISLIGAKLLYILENIAPNKKIIIELSGLSLFGAIYMVLLAVPLIAICTKKNILALYDFFSPFGLVLLACVRLGCFFNDCCGAVTIWNETNPIILPVQLMEVICDLLILEVCFKIEKRYTFKGLMYPVFMLLYGICRFLLEFLRNTPKNTMYLSHGQIFALISIFVSTIMIIIIIITKAEDERVKNK